MYADGDAEVLWVDILVPHQQFCSYRNLFECSIVNVTTVLEGKQVLFVSMACTLYEPHPARRFFVGSIEIVHEPSIFVDLNRKGDNVFNKLLLSIGVK